MSVPPRDTRRPLLDVRLGDVFRLRKPHPCGSFEWKVVRLGADIGIRCVRCHHRVLLPRPEFERRVRTLVARDDGGAAVGSS